MNDVFETIQSYLDGSMTADEKKLFEEQLKADPGLAETFRVYQGIDASMQTAPASDKDEEGLSLSLSTLGKEHFIAKPAVVKRMFRPWQAVAAVLVLVFGASLWLLRTQQKDNGDVYAKYAQHTPLDTEPRSGGNDTLASAAARAFNSKQYGAAAGLLETYTARDSTDTEMKLALGISYLELNKPDEARQIFNSIAAGATVFVNKAKWYTALSFLKQKQYDQCRSVLESIPQGADVYERAQELLKEISR